MALNVKRRKFCREYMIDGNGTQAAIRAGYSKRSANPMAARLLAMDSIKAEIARLEALADEAVVKAREYSKEWATLNLLEDREVARDTGKPSAMVAADMGLSRLHGLIKEGQGVTVNLNGFGTMLAELEARYL